MQLFLLPYLHFMVRVSVMEVASYSGCIDALRPVMLRLALAPENAPLTPRET